MVFRQIGTHLHRTIKHPIVARIFNSLSFYGGWTALVVYAASGRPYMGLAILTPLMLVHFVLSHQRGKDLLFLSSVTLAGCFIDIGLITSGVLTYASPNGWAWWAPPVWMAGVYLLFAAAVDYSLFWLRNYPVAAAVLGALGGMSSYAAGERLGAATFLMPGAHSLIVIGIVWFIFMPAVCWYSGWLDRHAAEKEL
ncbi:MAG: DUF2878 domain-containing protein [Chlamydiales bacterium]|nr:DUF2878 domain-containing protein [Chlamydiales bacterium]